MKVLIADDEPNIVTALEFLLHKSGHEVEIARNGDEVLALIASGAPDLVPLDVMMPLMTGFEVLVALKGDASTRGIPVLLVTAQSKEHEILRGLELGAEDYITKPFSPNELAARVKKTLLTRGQSPSAPSSAPG